MSETPNPGIPLRTCRLCGAAVDPVKLNICTNGHPVCRQCGSGPDLKRPDVCTDGQHFIFANKAAWTTGQHSDRVEPTTEVFSNWKDSWPAYRALVHTHIGNMHRWLNERRSRSRNIGHLRGLIDLIHQATELDGMLAQGSISASVYADVPTSELETYAREKLLALYPDAILDGRDAALVAQHLHDHREMCSQVFERLARDPALADAMLRLVAPDDPVVETEIIVEPGDRSFIRGLDGGKR